MNILQISAYESGGGAERVALSLHQAFLAQGHAAILAVSRLRKAERHANVLAIPETLGLGFWGRTMLALSRRLGSGGLAALARPGALAQRQLGYEYFDDPAADGIPGLLPWRPDVILCHNLHGGRFGLRWLSGLAELAPLALMLHDCWSFTGHCAHPFDCQGWLSGCPSCPALHIPPAIKRDGAARNLRLKRRYIEACRPVVVTPSAWLMDMVRRSYLGRAASHRQILFNGIEEVFFEPRDKGQARARLGLPPDQPVLLFAANTVRDNIWKDFTLLRAALGEIVQGLQGRQVRLLALGEAAPSETLGAGRIDFVPFQPDPARVADYYAAADLYLHAAKAETFSLTIAEAMASGLPVVATAAGAVPERILGLSSAFADPAHCVHPPERATGILTPPGGGAKLAGAALQILGQPELATLLGENGRAQAQAHYRLSLQAESFINLFRDMIADRGYAMPSGSA